MGKIRVFFDWFLRVGVSALLIIFLCFAPFSIMPDLLEKQSNINRGETFQYQGILELWHIETFEGGSVSRAKFLERQAIEFEKSHKGTYIVVETMDPEQFALNLKSGKKPNILSFGIGLGDDFAEDLIPLSASAKIREDLLIGGEIGAKQLAIPYILGGYAIMSKSTDLQNYGKIGVGASGTINPFCALEKNNIKATFFDDLDCDTYTQYDRFLKGQFDSLLGTQRDVYRIYNRQQKGNMLEVNFSLLKNYSDLLQYVSVFHKTDIEEKMSLEFSEKLLEETCQQKLQDINMFSVLEGATLYSSGVFCDMEKALNGNLYVPNVFLCKQKLLEEKQKYFDLLKE